MLYEWLWLGIWLVDSVVLPTVPETSGHNLQPRVCRLSDADHIMPGIVRRQAVSLLGAGTGQAVRMRLAAADLARGVVLRCPHGIQRRIFAPPGLSCRTSKNVVTMRWHLWAGQRRAADSAGKIF